MNHWIHTSSPTIQIDEQNQAKTSRKNLNPLPVLVARKAFSLHKSEKSILCGRESQLYKLLAMGGAHPNRPSRMYSNFTPATTQTSSKFQQTKN